MRIESRHLREGVKRGDSAGLRSGAMWVSMGVRGYCKKLAVLLEESIRWFLSFFF